MEMEMSNPSSSTQLTSHLVQELNTLRPLSPNRCIYRVPKPLRCVNEKAYTPQIVSIGPLHHGQKSLATMEEHKIRFVQHYLRRTHVSLEYFINVIKNKEEELRSYYEEQVELSSVEFVKIVLVDVLFIIELILKIFSSDKSTMNESDYIFDKPYMLNDIIPDLLLLENQLPLFILDDLFCEQVNICGLSYSMAMLSKVFFYDALGDVKRKMTISELQSGSIINHFVDLLIENEVPTKPEAQERNESTIIPTATKLHQFGVVFKVSKSENLFDIQLTKKGLLEIPKLTIVDSTERKLRNMIAFEQCHRKDKCASDYALFMSFLIHTCEDVEVLVKYKIIENRIGDNNRVAAMMYKLGDGVTRSKNFTFAKILDQLNSHCEIPWNKHKANLKQNYFDSPWTTLSVIAASLIIILTFIQTVCSVISTVNDLPTH